MNMKKFLDEDKNEIKIKKSLEIKRPLRTSTYSSCGPRTLFNSKRIDVICSDFDPVFPGGKENDEILKEKNPKLFAIRNISAKTKARPNIIKSVTASDQSKVIQTFFNRPATSIKGPRQNSVQKIQEAVEVERASLSFTDDPVTYFAKTKEGNGHKFIYLNYAENRKDPAFNPYNLEKVPYAEVDSEYFTMSATGVTKILPDGNTEQYSIDSWVKESSDFISIRKLAFFSKYYFWRPFRLWKKFVMKQRFNQLQHFAKTHPYFSNSVFFSSLFTILSSTSIDTMIKKYLLPFNGSMVYSLETFQQTIQDNKTKLHNEYLEYLKSVIQIIDKLYGSIKDPERIKVADSDFQEIKRKNPNITQLIILEKKIEAEKERRKKIVENEASLMSYYIRVIDYFLLESMSKSCSQVWDMAVENFTQEQSAIFSIEISFSENGSFCFNVNSDTLLDAVRKCLHDSFDILEDLPRLIHMPQLEKYMVPQITDGPTFQMIYSIDLSYSEKEEKIIDIIRSSFDKAEEFCQIYTKYYPIYKLGLTPPEDKYTILRGGENVEYNLTELIGDKDAPVPLIFNFSKEETIDFSKLTSDIERFKLDEQKMVKFHPLSVKGILCLDARKLRAILSPIPMRSLDFIHTKIVNLLLKKIEYIKDLFAYCSKKLNKEPASLEHYIQFCEFSNAIDKITPNIAMEISLTDELRGIINELSKIELNPPIEKNSNGQKSQKIKAVYTAQISPEYLSARNPLHDAFQHFKNDKQISANIIEALSSKFSVALLKHLRSYEQKLLKYFSSLMTFPTSLDTAKYEVSLPQMKQIKEGVFELEPKITSLTHFQEIMNLKTPDLSIFNDIKNGAVFSVNLYKAVKKYSAIKYEVENLPFSSLNIEKFKKDVDKLDKEIYDLRNAGRPINLLLQDLYDKFSHINIYVDQLIQLSKGNLQPRHWKQLFEECGKENLYTPQTTVNDLINLGILNQKEKINLITSNSEGESKVEMDFKNIKTKWLEIQLPLANSRDKEEESLLLGNTSGLFNDIADSQIRLQNLLTAPFVESISKDIKDLSLTLENYAHILDAWAIFQSNWLVLNSFFSHDEIKQNFETQTQKFNIVKKRWLALVRYTQEDPTIHHVFAFPSLLDMLIENNRTLESLLISSIQFIDKKRQTMPRLYFLSNDEALTLFSTTDFEIFNQHLVKLFMHIRSFDFSANEQNRNDKKIKRSPHVQDFSNLKVSGFVGDSLDNIVFTKHIECTNSIEIWVNHLVDFMHECVKNEIKNSLHKYFNSQINDWVMGVQTYIALLSVHAAFSREIDECFLNFENNPRAFQNYEKVINQRIDNMINAMASPLSAHELFKLSAVTTLYNSHLAYVKTLSEKSSQYSQKLSWRNHLKVYFQQKSKTIQLEFGDFEIEHGYEYWGSGVDFVHTPSTEKALLGLLSAIMNGEPSYILGSPMCGKKHLISVLASIFGQFLYHVPAFKDERYLKSEQLIIGAARTGSWLTFHNTQLNSHQKLCFIFEAIHEIYNKKNARKNDCIINGKNHSLMNSTMIFFTGNNSYYKSKEFPHQLRSFLRPIAIRQIDIKLVLELKLLSLNFKAAKFISMKLFLFLSSISHTFSYLNLTHIFYPCLKIADNAHSLLRVLMHRKTQKNVMIQSNHNLSIDSSSEKDISSSRTSSVYSFSNNALVDYYESARTAEEYSVARAIYNYFKSIIKDEDTESFICILYGHFQIFDNYDMFKSKLFNFSTFISDINDTMMREIMKSVAHKHFTTKTADYLIDKSLALYHMMENYPITIIYGPINSGKSSILDILRDTIQFLVTDAEENNKFSHVSNIKIYDWFFMGNDWNHMFGKVVETEDGPVWHYGQFSSFMNSLHSSSKNSHNILRLNGPLTKKLSIFLTEMLTSNDSSLIRTNTLNSYDCGTKFHIIIETDSIQNITPSLQMNSGLLPLCNLQFDKKNMLLDSDLIFNRAISDFKYVIDPDILSILHKLYSRITPEVVKYINESITYISESENYESIISDHLPYLSLQLALCYLKDSSPKSSYSSSENDQSEKGLFKEYDENQLKTVLVLALFDVFSGIVHTSCLTLFDSWIRTSFMVEIPTEWVGFNVPDQFWDAYQRPSILSLRFFKGKLIPLDVSFLLEKPLITKRQESQTFKLPMDVNICTAQYLPIICQARTLGKYRKNYLIHGTFMSGKSTLLKFVFNYSDDIIPIIIPISKITTGQDIFEFIEMHAPIIKKDYDIIRDSKTYALIFDNVPYDNLHAIEYIRMLVSTSSIPITSRKDSKFLSHLQLHSFFVIVLTENIAKLPINFLRHFYLMHLDSPTNSSMKFIIQEMASQFRISSKIITAITSIAEEYSKNSDTAFHFLRFFDVLSLIDGRSALNENETISLIKSFLFELNYLLCHKITNKDILNNIKTLFSNMFFEPKILELFDQVINGNDMIYPEISLASDASYITINYQTKPIESIREIFKDKLAEYNRTKGNNVIRLNFYRPTMDQLILLLRGLSYPGTSIVLRGSSGSGRFTLSKFAAFIKTYAFYPIPIVSPLDKIIRRNVPQKESLEPLNSFNNDKVENIGLKRFRKAKDRKEKIKNFLRVPLIDCILRGKQVVIFYRLDPNDADGEDELSNLFRLYDFHSYLNQNEINELYYKYANQFKLNPKDKLYINNQIHESLKLRLHIVIAADYSDKSINHTLTKYPHFVEIRFSQTNEYKTRCARDMLWSPALAPISNQFPENLPNLFTKIHNIIRKYFPANTMENQFRDFLSCFSIYAAKSYNELSSKHSLTKTAIDFIKELGADVKSVDKRLSRIIPQIHSLQNDDVNFRGLINARRQELKEQQEKLESEERYKTAKMRQLNEEIVPLRTELQDLNLRVDLSRKRFESITPQQFQAIKAIASQDNPPENFQALIEMYLIFLNQPAHFQSYGKRLILNDQNKDFLQIVLEKINPREVISSNLLKAKQLYNKNQFSEVYFQRISPTCAIMYDYINIIYQYASIKEKLEIKTREYEEKSVEYQEFSENMHIEKKEMTKSVKTLDLDVKALLNSVTALENLTKEQEDLEAKKRILDPLYKGFDALEQKWKTEFSSYEENMKLLIGNTIIFSVNISYLSPMSPKEKKDVFFDILEEMKKYSLNADYDSPEEVTKTHLADLADEINVQSYLQTDLRLIKVTPKIPLIIDPDGVIIEEMKSFYRDMVTTSVLSNNFFSLLKQAAQIGSLIAIEDVNFLEPHLTPFLSIFSQNANSSILQDLLRNLLLTASHKNPLSSARNTYRYAAKKKTTSEVVVDGETIPLHENFRIVLFTTLITANEIPENLRTYVTVIDAAEDSTKMVEVKITNCFLNYFDPEMMPRMSSVLRAEMENKQEVSKYEKMILNSILDVTKTKESNPKYDLITDEQSVGKILSAKECYFAALNVQLDHRAINTELNNTIEPFLKQINLCIAFWNSLNRYLPRVKSCHIFRLDQFLSLIETSISSLGFQQGILTQQQLETMSTSIVHHVMKWAFPMMGIKDSLLFLFISGFESLKLEEKANQEDLESIITHVVEEYDSSCDFVNIDSHSGDPLDLMKFSNIINIFTFIEKFVADSFGSDYYRFLPYFSLDAFLSNSPSIPILIQLRNAKIKDITQLLEYYISLHGKTTSFVSVSLYDDVYALDQAYQTIEEAAQTASCVALHYQSNNPVIASFINSLINALEFYDSPYLNPLKSIHFSKPLHPDFRMVIICTTTDGLLRNTLKKCTRIEYEAFPSIKHQLLEIYNHFSSLMQSANSPTQRKLNYAFSLLFSLVCFRRSIDPIGYTFEVPMDEMRLRSFIRWTMDSLDHLQTNTIPMKNLRDYLLDAEMGTGVYDEMDYKKLKNHIYSILTPELTEDGFHFIEQNSEESDKWYIPNDLPPNTISHFVEPRIPLFPTTDVLYMNRQVGMPFRNWSLSRWIAKSFLKLGAEQYILKNDEAEQKLKDILEKMPSKILFQKYQMKTTTQLFLSCEINTFNELIEDISQTISVSLDLIHSKSATKNQKASNFNLNSQLNTSITEEFCFSFIDMFKKNKFPEKWRNKIGISSTKNFQKFISILKEKHELLKKWLDSGIPPSSIDVKLITDVKGLLYSYLDDIALQRQMTTDVLTYDFVFGEQKAASIVGNGSYLCLTGISLVAGNWDHNERKLILPNPKTPPIFSMPDCLCVPVKVSTRTHHAFLCPLFRSMPSKSFMLESDKELYDGVASNFQWCIPLKTDLFEKALISTGVCLICQKPDNF